MRLLLDTHTLLWWLDDPARIHDEGRIAIANARNGVFVSAISMLEIAIKESLGKLEVPAGLIGCIETCRFKELPLTVEHAAALRTLPPVHRDPFDRALIAQAQAEGMTLVSRDRTFREYNVPLMAA